MSYKIEGTHVKAAWAKPNTAADGARTVDSLVTPGRSDRGTRMVVPSGAGWPTATTSGEPQTSRALDEMAGGARISPAECRAFKHGQAV